MTPKAGQKSRGVQLVALAVLLPCGVIFGMQPLSLTNHVQPPATAQLASALAVPITGLLGSLFWWAGGAFKRRRWGYVPVGMLVHLLAGIIAYHPGPITRQVALGLYAGTGLAGGAILWRLASEGYIPYFPLGAKPAE